MMLTVTINDDVFENIEGEVLRRKLIAGHGETYREIWLQHGEKSFCALANRDSALLMIVDAETDSSQTSRNPDYLGEVTELMPFRLANGQLDHYPMHWMLPDPDWVDALLCFAETGEADPDVTWQISE